MLMLQMLSILHHMLPVVILKKRQHSTKTWFPKPERIASEEWNIKAPAIAAAFVPGYSFSSKKSKKLS
jgi:hypothetical protein